MYNILIFYNNYKISNKKLTKKNHNNKSIQQKIKMKQKVNKNKYKNNHKVFSLSKWQIKQKIIIF